MKKLVVIIVLLSCHTIGWSQNRPPMDPSMGPPPMEGHMHPHAMERIHAAKMAYISDRLHLTQEQSVNFVPLYNQYEGEIRSTRQSFFKKYRGANPDQADDGTARQAVDDNLDYQQAVINIKRKYNDQFLRVISPQQLSDLYKAEREFKQMLMQRLHQHGGGQGNDGPGGHGGSGGSRYGGGYGGGGY